MKLFNLNRPVIVQAFNTGFSGEQEHHIVSTLSGLPCKRVIGCWSGNIEYSYVFVPHSHTDIHKLFKLAREYEQEAVLYLDQYRNALVIPADHYETAYLMLREGRSIHVLATEFGGKVMKWRAVDMETAHKSEGYTVDPKTNQHWIAA